jgi:hypothetical protein
MFFDGDSEYNGTMSNLVPVQARAKLTPPAVPSSIRSGVRVTSWGSIKPPHTAAQNRASHTKVYLERYSGGKWITIDYGRPLLRGRANIFGAGADYGKVVSAGAPVWRAGANATTALSTEVPLTFGGKTIAPGTYSVFVELKEQGWTFVLSSQPVQEKYDPNDKVKLFGAYNYDAKYDVVRVPMKMAKSPVSVEQFTVGFVNMTQAGGSIAMWWDKDLATVDFTVGSGS